MLQHETCYTIKHKDLGGSFVFHNLYHTKLDDMTLHWAHETLTIETLSGQELMELPSAAYPWQEVSFSEALAHPTEFPTLEKCATPDDRVVVAIDPATLSKGFSVPILLERLASAGISDSQITLLLPANASSFSFEQLRGMAAGCHIERHDPKDPSSKVILGGTREGAQIYLNRRLVEADLMVIVCGTRHGCAEESPASLIFPGMVCEPIPETRSGEVLNLLGAPYFLVEVDGPFGQLPKWYAGTMEAFRRAKHFRKQFWQLDLEKPVDMLVLDWSKDHQTGGFSSWARAVSRFLPCLEDGGRIVIVSSETVDETSWLSLSKWINAFQLREHEQMMTIDPELKSLRRWFRAQERISIFILNSMPVEICEELQANKINGLGNIQRIAAASERILVLHDPEKCVVIPRWSKADDETWK